MKDSLHLNLCSTGVNEKLASNLLEPGLYPLAFKAVPGLWLFHRFKQKMSQFVVKTQIPLMSKLGGAGAEQEGRMGC